MLIGEENNNFIVPNWRSSANSLIVNKGDITMVLAMFSWALYSTLLKRQKYELSQISLLQVVISFGLIFLIPIYFIEYQIGFRINIDTPFILILSSVTSIC